MSRFWLTNPIWQHPRLHMPTKRLIAEQANQYSDDECVKLIREFWNSGKSLNEFCIIKGYPSCQVMKRLLSISRAPCERSDSSSWCDIADIDDQYNDEQLSRIASSLAQLHAQLRSIKQEIESLMNGLHCSQPDK